MKTRPISLNPIPMNRLNAREIIRRLKLRPHPEGGYYRETYRAADAIPQAALPPGFDGPRRVSSAICFLLPRGARSRLHRIRSDELWHFHLGGSLTVVEIAPDGTLRKTILGGDLRKRQKLQHVVPAGHWFGAYLDAGVEFALVGCTVAPGFDFRDFEIARREPLLRLFPKARREILALT